ncbi:MAG: hypothetical protein QOI63_957 [Thermoplasmata archaeon]|nr:hypothetical protein [Thermoplasmata archaeon]
MALQAATALALILAAAKAHGRQLRLERVQAGHPQADFRAPDDPWVEALWRNDRIGFWTLFLALGAAGLMWALAAGGVGGGAFWGRFPVSLAWAFAGAFFVMGVQSLWRLADRDHAGWQSHAIGTSFLWWTLVALLFGVSAGLGR